MARDLTMLCVGCGEEFVFSAAEQQFFSEKGFLNQPKRCRTCRTQRRLHYPGRRSVETTVTCAQCGALTTVPFEPRQARPVYCRTCFSEKALPSAFTPLAGELI